MIRPPGKAQKIATAVLKRKGIKSPKASSNQKIQLQTPYLQH